MDKIFCYEKEYCGDIHNIDGLMVKNALQEFCYRYIDSFQELSFADSISLTGIPQQDYSRLIPVGSLEFVENILTAQTGHDVHLNPIEVPQVLRKYIRRDYRIIKGCNLTEEERSGKYFLKDATDLKLWNNALNLGRKVTDEINQDHLYVVTEAVEFESEWRLFVYKDKLVGAECYQGNIGKFPFQYTVRSMIHEYAQTIHPKAYTIDIGIRWFMPTEMGLFKPAPSEITEPIEIHPFVACGLYGFYDKCLPSMWREGYNWYLNENIGCEEAL